MEGRFIRIAEAILRAASEEGITTEQVDEIIGHSAGDGINCYPGKPGHPCHPLAVFVSLSGKLAKGRWGDYSFENILQEIVRHVQGKCPDVTRDVVLITDSWLAPNIEQWQANINTIIRSGVNVEVYLISYPNSVTPLRIY